MTDHDELSPPAEAPARLGDSRPAKSTSVRAAQQVLLDKITETPAAAVPSSTPAASSPPTVAEIPELEEVRRVHGETGVAQVLEAVQQVHAHVTAERAKLSELIPDWRDLTTRALELPEIIRFAKARGATDQQIEQFNLHGTAAELKNWRDFWRASHAVPEARDSVAPPAPARRRPVVREPVEIPARMGLHDAKRLLEKLVD